MRSEIATRSARLSQIVDLLPPDEAALRQQRTELAAIRGRLESMKAELGAERGAFRGFVEDCTDALLSSSSEIVAAFEEFCRQISVRACVTDLDVAISGCRARR